MHKYMFKNKYEKYKKKYLSVKLIKGGNYNVGAYKYFPPPGECIVGPFPVHYGI